MYTYSKIFLLLAPFLTGCALFERHSSESNYSSNQRQIAAPEQNVFQAPMAKQMVVAQSQSSAMRKKNINHYVRGMMQDLAENLQYVSNKTPLAVASFVYLDHEFDNATLLGNQLSESFMHELHTFGIPVVDFKATDYLRVTEKGDFIFSRDFLELNEQQNFKYVLAGTLVSHQGGVLVNSRIIGINSKAVVGTAQGFIPQSVVDALGSSFHSDGIQLKQVQ